MFERRGKRCCTPSTQKTDCVSSWRRIERGLASSEIFDGRDEIACTDAPVELVAGCTKRSGSHGLKAFVIVDCRDNGTAERGDIAFDKEMDCDFRRNSLERSIERGDRKPVEDVVQRLELEAAACFLNDQAESRVSENRTEIVNKAVEFCRM